MRIDKRTPLATVAVLIGDALRRSGIRGVLTGGACATFHSRGTYVSRDVDFVLPAGTRQRDLDEAMHSIGFARNGNRYVHPKSLFFAEFPAGPLAIGQAHHPTPVRIRIGRATAWSLSATDSCLDRLAAFYHWGDRQARSVALNIALGNRVFLSRIREWSAKEGKRTEFEAFLAELRRARAAQATRKR